MLACIAVFDVQPGHRSAILVLTQPLDVDRSNVKEVIESVTGLDAKGVVAPARVLAYAHLFTPRRYFQFRCVDGGQPDLFTITADRVAITDRDKGAVAASSQPDGAPIIGRLPLAKSALTPRNRADRTATIITVLRFGCDFRFRRRTASSNLRGAEGLVLGRDFLRSMTGTCS